MTEKIVRPNILPCDIFIKEDDNGRMICLIGLKEKEPFEIFFIFDKDKDFSIRKENKTGEIIQSEKVDGNDFHQYDLRIKDSEGYSTRIEGINRVFNPDFHNIPVSLSFLLRHIVKISEIKRVVKKFYFNPNDELLLKFKAFIIEVLEYYDYDFDAEKETLIASSNILAEANGNISSTENTFTESNGDVSSTENVMPFEG